MPSSLQQRNRRDTSNALSALGNVLLVLATLAVAGLVAYLVLNPPGVLDPAGQQSLSTATGTVTAPVATPPPSGTAPGTASGTAAPPPPNTGTSVPPGQLSLGTACGAAAPLLDRADNVRSTAIDDSDALDSASIADLTRELTSLSDISPAELNSLIDPLTAVLVDLNNSILAGEDNPELDTETATASTEAIRELC